MRLTVIATLLLLTTNLYGQLDSIQVSVTVAGSVGTIGYQPFHIGYNQFGKLDPNDQDGYLETSFRYPVIKREKWGIETGLDYVIKPDLSNSFFHQAYAKFNYQTFEVRFGKVQVNNSLYNDELGSGSFFQSQNARTITKGGFGIWDFSPIPFTKFIQVMGTFEVGRLEEDRPVSNAYIHEKSAYLKVANIPIEPFIGINHTVIFGGTNELGVELPSNFTKAMLAQQAVNSGNSSDSSNATGAHFGMLNIGFDLPFDDNNNFRFIFQQLISDASGFTDNYKKNHDYVITLNLELPDNRFIKNIFYENFNTVDQSGPGLTDPYINGRFFSTRDIRNVGDYDQFALNQLGIDTMDIGWPGILELVRDEVNNGYAFGGRDDHFNNDQYPNGNTFHQQVLGNPLMMTQDRFQTMTDKTTSDDKLIINNRVIAHHFGFGSQIGDYKVNLKATISHNYGTYAGLYGGSRRSWDIDTEYFFRDVVSTQYVSLEGQRSFENGFTYAGTVAADYSLFGNNYGFFLRVTYAVR